MLKRTLLFILLASAAVSGLTGCSTMPEKQPMTAATSLEAQTFQRTLPPGGRADYLLHLPKDYRAGTAQRWPLILFLHGSGERGTDVNKVRTHGPTKYLVQHPELPFIVVSPQCPPGEHWSSETLLALLDDVSHRYAVDTTRVYLTGLSMGGYGSWELGTSHPERFAAIVPICGGGEFLSVLLAGFDGRGPALKSLPIWAFHGGKDTTVPLAESQRMVKFVRDAGCQEVELTVYPNAGHDSWTETYNNPRLYEWLLRHQRTPGK